MTALLPFSIILPFLAFCQMVVQPSFWNLVRTQPTDFITHTHFGGGGGRDKER